MKKIIFFSNNKNKIKEISNLFIKFNYKLLSLNDFKNTESPIENGKTFKDNAKIKSIYGYKKFNQLCFADDSGICIDALNGAPGINSKKYLESEKNKNTTLNKIIYPNVLLVPLVAFDRDLNRIGYGGGFYDRYIYKIKKNKKIITIGLAYSFQKVKKIPVKKYDFKLDYIVTNKGIICEFYF